MEEGRKVYHFELTHLEKWLKESVSDFFARYPERKYKLHILTDDSALPLQLDRSAMLLAIHNLLDNAVKFSSEQSNVDVILEQHAEEYRLDIKDEGIGIPIEEQERIFEKFYRGVGTSHHAASGTGLGLAIVRQIVHAHGGTVQVESSPDNGSKFRVVLPCNTAKSK
jgi:two-component system phosphate regulon sensor histidine kinase PhoR